MDEIQVMVRLCRGSMNGVVMAIPACLEHGPPWVIRANDEVYYQRFGMSPMTGVYPVVIEGELHYDHVGSIS